MKKIEYTFDAERFRQLMKDRGLTDGTLAYASGVSKTMIFYMKKGQRNKVSGQILTAVARALKTSEQYLMGHTDIAILKPYLHLTQTDMRSSHQQHGPVDTL